MHDVVAELRHTRRSRRLGDVEWFDLAYRVYLVALLGGGAVIVMSGWVGDRPATAAEASDFLREVPGLLGILVMAAVALGLRSGADGGPVSVEAADVRHLLLAPVLRARVLRQPLVQRGRSAAFAAAVAGAIAGELAAQRLPGSPVAWATSGAVAAACVGVLFVATAAIAHALGVSRAVATVLGVLVVGVQVAAVATDTAGPGDPLGSLALWGAEQDPADLVAVVATVAVAAAAVALVGRLRIEPLVRRADLVSQLRFAVTMQDLRTVVLLRRQLRNEQPRRRPWIRTRTGTAAGRRPTPTRAGRLGVATAGWRRGLQGVLRTPVSRLGRMAAFAAGAGACAAAVDRGTTPAIVPMALLLFLLGLDLVEPLSQEIDHPGRTDGYPHERGAVHLSLLLAPMVLAVPYAAIGAAVVTAFDPDAAAAAFSLAVPVVWLGGAGSVVNAVRDASPSTPSESVLVPPELAGFSTAMRMLVPVVVSVLATVPVLVLREQPDAGTVVRSIVGCLLVLGFVGRWVQRRDAWKRSWDAFVAGAQR